MLARLRASGCAVPVIMATAQGDERIAVEAMQAGATDHVVKTTGYFTTLPTIVNKVLKQQRVHGGSGWHGARPLSRPARRRTVRRARVVRIQGRARQPVLRRPADSEVSDMGAKETILLVEDDRFLRRAAEMGLRQHGFAVVTAVDGEEGLRRARTTLPDIVLLDLLMPRLSGLDVLRALKEDPATRSVPVLILSNSSREQDIEDVRALGAEGYWVKADMSLEDLAERVHEILGVAR